MGALKAGKAYDPNARTVPRTPHHGMRRRWQRRLGVRRSEQPWKLHEVACKSQQKKAEKVAHGTVSVTDEAQSKRQALTRCSMQQKAEKVAHEAVSETNNAQSKRGVLTRSSTAEKSRENRKGGKGQGRCSGQDSEGKEEGSIRPEGCKYSMFWGWNMSTRNMAAWML